MVQAIQQTVADGNLCNHRMYRVLDHEFAEYEAKDNAKRRRLDEPFLSPGSAAKGKGKYPKSAKGAKGGSASAKICYAYNEGNCRGRCQTGFAHICWTCAEKHPACERAGC